jgi:hypothetical protein
MPQMGFEQTTPVIERAKTVHALDRSATVIGIGTSIPYVYFSFPVRITYPLHYFVFDFVILVILSEECNL